MHGQVSVTFDKREALCILMQYEIELIYTCGITALKFILYNVFFYVMTIMCKPGSGQHFFRTANSL